MLSTMICNLTSIPQIINDRTYATKQNLIVKTIKKDEGTLYIIKYDKSKLNKDNTISDNHLYVELNDKLIEELKKKLDRLSLKKNI